jgi:C4-dicarboxylate transporter, DctQ subunit
MNTSQSPRTGTRSLAGVAWLVASVKRVEEVLLSSMILLIASLTIANVVSRTVTGISLAFTEELSQFLIVGVTFVGLSYATGRGRHIRMTAVYDQMSERNRKAMIVIISTVTCLLMLALAGYSWHYIATVRFLNSVSPVLQVPLHLVYLVVPLGLILAAIQYGLTVARNCLSDGVYLSFDVKDEYDQAAIGET